MCLAEPITRMVCAILSKATEQLNKKASTMATNDEQLKKAGLKVTSPRVKILEILKQPENQHISAGRL